MPSAVPGTLGNTRPACTEPCFLVMLGRGREMPQCLPYPRLCNSVLHMGKRTPNTKPEEKTSCLGPNSSISGEEKGQLERGGVSMLVCSLVWLIQSALGSRALATALSFPLYRLRR